MDFSFNAFLDFSYLEIEETANLLVEFMERGQMLESNQESIIFLAEKV